MTVPQSDRNQRGMLKVRKRHETCGTSTIQETMRMKRDELAKVLIWTGYKSRQTEQDSSLQV